jgi:hypothetical protein
MANTLHAVPIAAQLQANTAEGAHKTAAILNIIRSIEFQAV